MSILLVTGSRALADTPRAEQWAREQLRLVLRSGMHVYCGDAPGVDTYAREIVGQLRPRGAVRVYQLDGRVILASGEEERTIGITDWTTYDVARDRGGDPKTWPLKRNRAMVDYVAFAARSQGTQARCFALIAPWSRTHGTEHTARLAERAGIAVERAVCPKEYGP